MELSQISGIMCANLLRWAFHRLILQILGHLMMNLTTKYFIWNTITCNNIKNYDSDLYLVRYEALNTTIIHFFARFFDKNSIYYFSDAIIQKLIKIETSRFQH